MCSVWPMLIFQTMYAVQRPVTASVAARRTERLFKALEGVRMRRAEAYALGCAGRPLEGLGGAPADREHGPGAVRAAVDPDPLDPRHRLGLLEPLRLAFAVEEADARAAPAPARFQAPGLDRLAKCRRECERVQVDPERGLAELRVVAAADPSGELEHARTIRSDPQLDDRRAFADPDRLD